MGTWSPVSQYSSARFPGTSPLWLLGLQIYKYWLGFPPCGTQQWLNPRHRVFDWGCLMPCWEGSIRTVCNRQPMGIYSGNVLTGRFIRQHNVSGNFFQACSGSPSNQPGCMNSGWTLPMKCWSLQSTSSGKWLYNHSSYVSQLQNPPNSTKITQSGSLSWMRHGLHQFSGCETKQQPSKRILHPSAFRALSGGRSCQMAQENTHGESEET